MTLPCYSALLPLELPVHPFHPWTATLLSHGVHHLTKFPHLPGDSWTVPFHASPALLLDSHWVLGSHFLFPALSCSFSVSDLGSECSLCSLCPFDTPQSSGLGPMPSLICTNADKSETGNTTGQADLIRMERTRVYVLHLERFFFFFFTSAGFQKSWVPWFACTFGAQLFHEVNL